MRNTKCLLTLAVFLAASLNISAQSQQQQPPPKPPEQKEKEKAPAKKAKKVWGEDDVKDLRKPWDEHSDQKRAEADAKAAEEAKAAAEKAAGAAAPAEEPSNNPIDPSTGKPYLDPDSAEALQKQLTGWEAELKRTEELLAEARKRMTELTDNPSKWESAKNEVDVYEENVQAIKQKIADLGPQVEAAKKKEGAKKPAAPPAPKPE